MPLVNNIYLPLHLQRAIYFFVLDFRIKAFPFFGIGGGLGPSSPPSLTFALPCIPELFLRSFALPEGR